MSAPPLRNVRTAQDLTGKGPEFNDNAVLQSYCPEILFEFCHQVFVPINFEISGVLIVIKLSGVCKFAGSYCRTTQIENNREFGNSMNRHVGLDSRSCSEKMNGYIGSIINCVCSFGGDGKQCFLVIASL